MRRPGRLDDETRDINISALDLLALCVSSMKIAFDLRYFRRINDKGVCDCYQTLLRVFACALYIGCGFSAAPLTRCS